MIYSIKAYWTLFILQQVCIRDYCMIVICSLPAVFTYYLHESLVYWQSKRQQTFGFDMALLT